MKQHFERLCAIAQKKERRIIGLMSGTSLDGLDVALCLFQGSGPQTSAKVERFATIPYDAAFQSGIRTIFAQNTIPFQELVLLNVEIAERHADMINQCLAEWGIASDDVDLIASHGQTVFHAPRHFHAQAGRPNATLQIGDGDHIAQRTGIITLSDFRQKHIAAGGEGAPLALYGDYLLFSNPGEERVLLNIGGIANFTWLPADGDAAKALATDTGPGNTLLDNFARELFDVPFDRDALLAMAGRVETGLLEALCADPFFDLPFPKTSGPEHFGPHWVRQALDKRPKGQVNPYDLMATLTKLTAQTITDAIRRLPFSDLPKYLYLSGGGAHNPLVVSHLSDMLPDFSLRPMSDLGIDGDAKEAVLFAVLANECVAGSNHPEMRLNGLPLMSMGKVSVP